MKKSKMIFAASALALAVSATPASAFEKGVSVSADAGSHDAWGSTIMINGHFNSVSLSQYAVGGDSIKTIDYKHELTNLDSPLRMSVGLSGMKSDYSDSSFGDKDYEAGYGLGISLSFGYEVYATRTSFNVSLTEEVAESRFKDGQIFDAGVTQRISDNVAIKAGFRQIDREVDGKTDELLETGYLGLKLNF